MSERAVSNLNKPDVALEMTLRPSLFSEFTGQLKGFPGKARGVRIHGGCHCAPGRRRQNFP